MDDIIIIGAGIIGCQLAYDLSFYPLKVTVLEKNHEIMMETSNANSGIIHAGYDPEDGTMKAKLNVKSVKMMRELCQKLGVAYKQNGSLVLAQAHHIEHLDILEGRAKSRGVTVERLNSEELLNKSSIVNPEIKEALYFEDTAIISPWELGHVLMREAKKQGVKLHCDEQVRDFNQLDDGMEVITKNRSYKARQVINCAGLNGARIAALYNPESKINLEYRKGEYLVARHPSLVKNHPVLYPIPDYLGKGVLLVPTIGGDWLLGPSNHPVTDPYREEEFEDETIILDQLSRLITDVSGFEIVQRFAGIRPSSVDKDFVIQRESKSFINVIGIDSPGLASAPAISGMVIEEILKLI